MDKGNGARFPCSRWHAGTIIIVVIFLFSKSIFIPFATEERTCPFSPVLPLFPSGATIASRQRYPTLESRDLDHLLKLRRSDLGRAYIILSDVESQDRQV
jgi:hypothetical protein